MPWTQHHIPNVRGPNIQGHNKNAPEEIFPGKFFLRAQRGNLNRLQAFEGNILRRCDMSEFLVSRGEVLGEAGRADPAEGTESQREDVAHDVLDIAGIPAPGIMSQKW